MSFHLDQTNWIEGDVFQELRKLRDRAESYDVIILDPPKFAATSSQAEKAARGYKDINLLAFKLLKPGGILFTFSCSGGISPGTVSNDRGRCCAGCRSGCTSSWKNLARHPIIRSHLNFPEGEYLKGLICRK